MCVLFVFFLGGGGGGRGNGNNIILSYQHEGQYIKFKNGENDIHTLHLSRSNAYDRLSIPNSLPV